MFGHYVINSMNRNMTHSPYNFGLNGHINIRQQPYQMNAYSQWNWNPYEGQLPYNVLHYQQNYHPYFQHEANSYNPTFNNQPLNYKKTPSIFHNPLQTWEDPIKQQQNNSFNGNPFMHPYPKQSFISKQPSGMKSIMNSFKSQDGSLDFSKMIDTAGQMVNAVNQVSGLVKGLGGMFKV